MLRLILRQSRCILSVNETRCERGFTLPEAMIAAMITASVAVATTQTLGITTRAAHASHSLETVAHEAAIITTRLNAGLTQNEALKGMDNWRLTSDTYTLPNTEIDRRNDEHLVVLTLSALGETPFEVSTIQLSQ